MNFFLLVILYACFVSVCEGFVVCYGCKGVVCVCVCVSLSLSLVFRRVFVIIRVRFGIGQP